MAYLAFKASILCFAVSIFFVVAESVNLVKDMRLDFPDSFTRGQKLDDFVFKSPEKFDIFTFTQAWPKTVCFKGQTEHLFCNKTLDLPGWTIHGLWPSRRSGKEPGFCGGKKFSIKKIKPLMSDILKYWPNLFKNSKKDALWEHEWKKHGTCAVSDKLTGNEYLFFKKALDLFKELNITGALRKMNVVPSDTKTYHLQTIYAGLTQHFHDVKPVITCLAMNNKSYLDQIQTCYDKKFKMVDCLEEKRVSTKHETEKFWSVKRFCTWFDSIFGRGVSKMNRFKASDSLTDEHTKTCNKLVSYPTM